jgi:hypothetical protein
MSPKGFTQMTTSSLLGKVQATTLEGVSVAGLQPEGFSGGVLKLENGSYVSVDPYSVKAVEVPDVVVRQIQSAIAVIVNYNEQLICGRNLDARFSGEGRYEADTHQKLITELHSALCTISKFRDLAIKNRVDPDFILQSLSYVGPIQRSEQAIDYADQS